MIEDWVLSERAEHTLAGSSPEVRLEFYRVLTALVADPHPDGVTKFRLNFGAYVSYRSESLLLAYDLENGGTVLRIAHVELL